MMGAQLSNRNFDQTVVYIERATWKYYNICTENDFFIEGWIANYAIFRSLEIGRNEYIICSVASCS